MSGLRHCFDTVNQKSYTTGTTIRDMITGASGTNSIPNSAVSWMNAGVNAITITAAITRLTENTAYAANPFSKFTSTTDNTFNLYVFGNFNNTTPAADGRIAMYSNRGGTWNTVGSSSYVIPLGQTVIATWQINSTDGGQLWINGTKYGARSGAGIFGSSNNTTPLTIWTPPTTAVLTLNYATIYDRELTDTEILQNFNAIRGRYNL